MKRVVAKGVLAFLALLSVTCFVIVAIHEPIAAVAIVVSIVIVIGVGVAVVWALETLDQ